MRYPRQIFKESGGDFFTFGSEDTLKYTVRTQYRILLYLVQHGSHAFDMIVKHCVLLFRSEYSKG